MTIEFIAPDNHSWTESFARLPFDRQDIFYSPSYARLCQQTIHRDDQVFCALDQTATGPILYPFALRDLEKLIGPAGAGSRDMIGLYGRNGIACSDRITGDERTAFHQQMTIFARQNKVICSFDRYHPIWANEAQANPLSKTIDVGGFVVVDLSGDIESVEARMKYSVRKDLKKAERNGVKTYIAAPSSSLDPFMEIYEHTMDRNNAREFYYFDRAYFEKTIEILPNNSVIIYATLDDKLVSCELALYHGLYAHSFLGGTLRQALPSAANHKLKRDLMVELKTRGCQWFLLGGGQSAGDGVERYKQAYAPEHGLYPSRIGGVAFDPAGMETLKQQMITDNLPINTSRFQFYDPN
jgi:Acetyltransferase (GNAT) domain